MSTVTAETAVSRGTGSPPPTGADPVPPNRSRSAPARGWLSDADHRFWLVVLAVTALGSWLALHDLAGPSLWSDEVSSVAIAGGVGPALWHGIASDGGNMALYYLLLHVEINLFGDGPFALRLLSALAAAATVPMTALVGRRLAGPRAALVAAVLVATSIPLVADAHEARSYALVTLLVVAAWWAFLRLAERPSWPRLVPWVLLSAGAIACHLLATLFVAAMVATLLVAGARLVPARLLLAGSIGIGILCSPLALLAARRGTGQISWVAPVRLQTVLGAFAWLESARAGPLALASTSAAWIAGGALCLVTARRSGDPRDRLHALAPVAWVLVPVGGAVAASLLIHPVLVPRYVVEAVPGLAILAGIALARIRSAAAVTVLALGLAALTARVEVGPIGSIEQQAQAAAYVLHHAESGDAIAFYTTDERMPFAYYWRQAGRPSSVPTPIYPDVPFGRGGRAPLLDPPPPRRWSATDAVEAARLHARLWLLISHQGRPRGPTASNYHRFLELRSAILSAWRLWRTWRYRNVTVQLYLRRAAVLARELRSGQGLRGGHRRAGRPTPAGIALSVAQATTTAARDAATAARAAATTPLATATIAQVHAAPAARAATTAARAAAATAPTAT